MSGRTQDKTVIVTGAARGQGRVAAEHLAQEGAHVWVTDVLDDEGLAFVASWRGSGTLRYQHLDVAEEKDWIALASALTETGESVAGLVNNAGIAARGRLPEVDLVQWRRVFDINVTGALLGMQILHPFMGVGTSVVNVVSIAGLAGHAAAPYTASKWALRGLSRTAALEYGEQGIRVNAIFPGFIDTPLMASASPAFRDAAVRETPLGRVGVAEDIAPLIVYLISDESSFMNGAEIAIDGGLTSHVSHKSIADATKGS